MNNVSGEKQKQILSENLKFYLSLRQMLQKDLALKAGLSKNAITEYIRCRSYPSPAAMQHMADALGILISDLRESREGKKTIIPVLGTVPAGIPIEAVQDIVDYEEITAAMARSGDHFALRIRGDSMEPRIKEGDVVIVRKQDTVENGQVAIVMINGDDATVKKFYRNESGVSLIGYNPSFVPMFYTPEQVNSLPVRVIGRVVELRAKF